MYSITLIGTYHKAKGICNLAELYKIMETVNPEVIFEELPPSCFDAYYKDKTDNKLESDAINKYIENHQIEHIPIDYDNVPPASFFRTDQYMHERIERRSYTYRNLIDVNSFYIEHFGFKYLNSIDCMNLYKRLDDEIGETLQAYNDEKLFQIRKAWNYLNEKREFEMIKNIYNYSTKYKYNTGLFLIGTAHREAIINKIKQYEIENKLKLNWNYSFFNNVL
jgi:hypothetical protein